MKKVITVSKFVGLFVFGLVCGLLLLSTTQSVRQNGTLFPISITNKRPVKVTGFLPFWLIGKSADSYAKYLTEVSYFNLTIDSDGTIKKMANPKEQEPGWTALSQNSNLSDKLTVAKTNNIGLSLTVFSSNEEDIKSLLTDPQTHARNLTNDIEPIIKKWGFTDINLDVESIKNATPEERSQFTSFVAELKKQLSLLGNISLTVDVQAISLFQPYLTDVPQIGKYADYIFLMAYDFHYPGSIFSGAVAPMGGAGNVRVFDVSLSLDALLASVAKEKIILGIPLYGYEWKTMNNVPGSPAIPTSGVLASDSRVDQLISDCTTCVKGIDSISLEPYVIYPEGSIYHQIFYQDSTAISYKLKLATQKQIAGVGFWALGYEAPSTLESVASYKQTSVLFK